MKAINCKLTEAVVTSYGDKTKTYIKGRVKEKEIAGKKVIGAPLVAFADVQTAYGVSPGHCVINPATGRKFELQNINNAPPTILAFNFDTETGIWEYIGKIIMALPPTSTFSLRGFDFDDSDVNNIKIFVSATATTTLCQGGTYYTWNLALTDFTISGTTIFLANAPNQKAVYFAQYAGQVGLLHSATTSGGACSGRDFPTLANKTKFFQQNGAAATMQIYGWDTSLGNPSVDGTVTNGISSQTTPFAGTSPSAYFRMGASQNGYSTTPNTTAAFESVILQNGSTNIPSNFVQSLTTQTLYFMRDLQLVSGVWYFNLSTTSTGAAVVPAQTSATFSMMRSSGISSSHSLFKTGNIAPAPSGTLLASNCFGTCVPTSAPANPALNGEECFFFGTLTNLYLGKLSDLVDASTTWASLSGVNVLGTGIDYITPTVLFCHYSTSLDCWIFCSNITKFYKKRHQNSVMDAAFGALSTEYMELKNAISVPFGLNAIITMTAGSGWLFITGSTTGQRGVVALDLRSDDQFNYSYIVSKILKVPKGSVLRYISTDESEADFTGDCRFYVKSALTESDVIFDDPDADWTEVYPYDDNNPFQIGPYFQVRIGHDIIVDAKNISPAQLHDVALAYDGPGEIDDNFTWETERTSKDGDSPMIVSVRQVSALSAAPNKFLLVGYDDDGNEVYTVDSSVTPGVIGQSSNRGSSYTPFTNMAAFMTSFNSGSGNTELKITITSPPPIDDVTWSFKYE